MRNKCCRRYTLFNVYLLGKQKDQLRSIMGLKGTKLYSIFNAKCPVCHEGRVFKYKSVYNIKKFDKMEETCSHCGHKYEMETGFFYGAMYVAYAVSVAFSVAAFLSTYLLFPNTPYWAYIIIVLSTLVILAPVTFRAGRLIWINFFSSYDPEKAKK